MFTGISTTDLAFFQNEGYLKIPSFIPPGLLTKLRELFVELMESQTDTGKAVHEIKGKKYITNLEEICCKGNLSALELLGYPPLLQIAQTICGNDFFLIQEFAVIKNLGDEMPVLWHQDMLHERKGKCFTMGIYLDDVEEGDGALRIVPRSHTSGKHICELAKEPFIEIPAKAGDILIHDMMLAHSSEPMRKNKIRRVIYFEFLSAAHVKEENIYTEELVERRCRLTSIACRYYGNLHPEDEIFKYTNKDKFDLENKLLKEILDEIYSMPVKARPSTYCLQNGIAVFG